MRSGVRATGPAAATVSPSPGGRGRRRRTVGLTDAHFLWLLVALEVAAHLALRHWSRSHHGG